MFSKIKGIIKYHVIPAPWYLCRISSLDSVNFETNMNTLQRSNKAVQNIKHNGK